MNETFNDDEERAEAVRRLEEAATAKATTLAVKRNAAMDSFYKLQDQSRKGRKRFHATHSLAGGDILKKTADGKVSVTPRYVYKEEPCLRGKDGKVIQTLKPANRNGRYTNYPVLKDFANELTKAKIGWKLLALRIGATPEQLNKLDNLKQDHNDRCKLEKQLRKKKVDVVLPINDN